MTAQICFQYDQSRYNTHALQYLDVQAQRAYPVSLSENNIRCLIVPHCTDDSAQCLAAAAYRNLQGQQFDKIIMMCALDRDAIDFYGIALPCRHIDCCSNCMKLSCTDIAKLSQYDAFHYYQLPFCDNYPLLQQIKMLEFYLHSAEIIPLMVGNLSLQDIEKIAVVLTDCATPKTLIIICCNFARYDNCVQSCLADSSKICMIYDQDAYCMQAIQSAHSYMIKNVLDDPCTASTYQLFFHMLYTPLLKNVESVCVGYASSLYDQVPLENITTYGSFIMQDSLTDGYTYRLGRYDQLQLLQHARLGLQDIFQAAGRRLPCMMSYAMSQPYGLFVTLYHMLDHGPVLQGCMGVVETQLPLYQVVYDMAQQAACHDTRFYPLRHKDLESTIISLSVMTDISTVEDYEKIHPRQGVMLQYFDKKAIYLPRSMIKESFSYESILTDLSKQIHRHADVWHKPESQIFTFHSLVFQEE